MTIKPPTSTGQALDLLGLPVTPANHYAGNLYMNALEEINFLQGLLVELAQVTSKTELIRTLKANEIMRRAGLAE